MLFKADLLISIVRGLLLIGLVEPLTAVQIREVINSHIQKEVFGVSGAAAMYSSEMINDISLNFIAYKDVDVALERVVTRLEGLL